MSAMKPVIIALALLVVAPVLAACEPSGGYDPIHCDYEQASTSKPVIEPADRAEWVDYNGDGVIVLCMWASLTA